MNRNKFISEYVLLADGLEICSCCGHAWQEEGAGHYPDCRYFTFEEDIEEDMVIQIQFPKSQLPLFRPAA
jgi:hypothetical protein